MSSHVERNPARINPEIFRRTCARFATGIAVATVRAEDGTPYGITVNSFTSVSCSPPLVLVCVDYRSRILPHFRMSDWFGINVLSEEQTDVSMRFSQPELERFGASGWRFGTSGVPLLEGVLAQFECAVTQVIEAGDHAIFIGEVVRTECREGDPLVYFGSRYCGLRDHQDPEF